MGEIDSIKNKLFLTGKVYIQEVVFVEISPIIVCHGRTHPFQVGAHIFLEIVEGMGKSIHSIYNKLHFGICLEVW